MTLDITMLQKKQMEVDAIILEKCTLSKERLAKHLSIALAVEAGELANELGWFKHWKHQHVANPARVEEEFADCLAFTLALMNMYGQVYTEEDQALQERIHKDFSEFPMTVQGNIDDLSTLLFTSASMSGIYEEEESEKDSYIKAFLGMLLVFGKRSLMMTDKNMELAYLRKADKSIQRQKQGY